MDYRGLVVIGAVACAATLPLLPACTAPDPGAITFVPRAGGANPADESGDSTSSGSVPTDAGASSSSSSGAPGVDAGITAESIFAGETFAFQDPGETADGQPAPHAPPMAGKACVVAGCHGAPVGTGAPPWSAGGSVYADIKGTAFALPQKVEIRIVDPTNNVVGASIFPDAQGNFWLDAAGKPIPEGSHVAIRQSGGTPSMMTTALTAATGSNCNATGGCHGDAANRIFAP